MLKRDGKIILPKERMQLRGPTYRSSLGEGLTS